MQVPPICCVPRWIHTLNASRAASRSALIIDQARQNIGAREYPVIRIRRGVPLWIEISWRLVVGVCGLLSSVAENFDIAEHLIVRIPDGLPAHGRHSLKILVEKEMESDDVISRPCRTPLRNATSDMPSPA
jgi:hypothetical protein